MSSYGTDAHDNPVPPDPEVLAEAQTRREERAVENSDPNVVVPEPLHESNPNPATHPEVEDEPEPVGEGSDNPDEAPDGC